MPSSTPSTPTEGARPEAVPENARASTDLPVKRIYDIGPLWELIARLTDRQAQSAALPTDSAGEPASTAARSLVLLDLD